MPLPAACDHQGIHLIQGKPQMAMKNKNNPHYLIQWKPQKQKQNTNKNALDIKASIYLIVFQGTRFATQSPW